MSKPFDVFQDVHGQGDKLEALLQKLGYVHDGDSYVHPEKTALFLGDLIDNGTQNALVIDIVRPMEELGRAVVILGNHEFNAICYSMRAACGDYLRPHTDANKYQHKEFLSEFPLGSQRHESVINWFRTLPIAFEANAFRAIHAVWCESSLRVVKRYCGGYTFGDSLSLTLATDECHELCDAIEVLLKGYEVELPDGISYKDKYGIPRSKARLKWWGETMDSDASSSILSVPSEVRCALSKYKLGDLIEQNLPPADKPTFIGHYKMSVDEICWSGNVICLDHAMNVSAYRFKDCDNITEGSIESN
ncbi:Bis(5'-nucleosyl)-tetraphosphatase PrpE (asymmetrical) [Vibrio chagasii]|nr:Bis(5'-nucleosyl)-tetraphosphatase PrpE (asymmetrical) [Vibrio chagasii]